MLIGSASTCEQQNDQVVIIRSSILAVKIFHAKIKNPGSKDRALGYPLRVLNGFSHLAVVCWSDGVVE
jgi:hypothetical protein